MNQVRHVPKPWGFELWWAVTDAYAGKLLHINRGHQLSLQYHEQKDESCYLLSGLVHLTHGPSLEELSVVRVGPGEAWRNLPGEIHTIEAIETSVVIEASTPHLDDVVRLNDPYGRSHQAAARVLEAPQPPRFIDREQLAAKLEVTRGELAELLRGSEVPPPAGYFRGRLLWHAASIDAWLERDQGTPDVVHAAQVAATG